MLQVARKNFRAFCLVCCYVAILSAHGSVLYVPDEYPTIQSALNATTAGDSVIVAYGIYPEAVVTPHFNVFLIGVPVVDSSGVSLPIIDPSSLPNPQSLTCLHIQSSNTLIENFELRNGPEMYPRMDPFEGGIRLGGNSVTLRNCTFDSTYTAIRSYEPVSPLTIEHCFFFDVNYSLLCPQTEVHATDCYFLKKGFACAGNSVIAGCVFDSISPGYALNTVGHVTIQSCIFKQHDATGMPTIDAAFMSGLISGNTFLECRPSSGIIVTARNCGAELLIENNRFENIDPYAQSGRAISWGCEDGTHGGSVIYRGNVFTNCSSELGGKCFFGFDSTALEVNQNYFIDNPGNNSTISSTSRNSVYRRNVFIGNQYALNSTFSCDARLNFWGDSSGPYHPTLNPDGLGDRVSDSVLFDSWYPDTSFLINATDERAKLPTQFALFVYPNPFNSTARISLKVADPFIASINLVNILSQLVREIHGGPVYGREEFTINADNLPSGIYFITVRDVIKNSVKSAQKIALIR